MKEAKLMVMKSAHHRHPLDNAIVAFTVYCINNARTFIARMHQMFYDTSDYSMSPEITWR